MNFAYRYRHILYLLAGLMLVICNLKFIPANAKDLTYLSQLRTNSYNNFSSFNLGIDATYLIVGHNSDYLKIFRKNRGGGNVYLGYHFNGLMLEIGYGFTTRRAKSSILEIGSSFLGEILGVDTQFIGKVRFKNTHFTLNFFADLSQDLKIVSALGLGFVRPITILHHFDRVGNPTDYQGKIQSQTNLVPRLGLGISVISTPKVSWRIMGYFEKFSKIKYKTAPIGYDKPFKNAYTCLIGVLFKF